MGTRSSITICEDGVYTGVYCHWDGYLSHNGEILLNNYDTAEKVRELISFGDMSSLREKVLPNPAEPHTFDKPQDDVCVFYYRDRGESWEHTKPFVSGNEKEYYSRQKQEYNYLFEDGKWYWNDSGNENWKNNRPAWKLLTREDIAAE